MGQGQVLRLPHVWSWASKGMGAVSSAVKVHIRAHPQGLLTMVAALPSAPINLLPCFDSN